MTLYRKLLLTVLLIFSSLLFVVFFVQFTSTKDYLRAQQESDIFNTATSLGLSLTPFLETGDKIGAETVINVVFDGGYYQKISLDLFVDNVDISRNNPKMIAGVPRWFSDLNLFSPIVHQQVLNSQWLQYGRLLVVGHPGVAYRELWLSSVDLLKWFAVVLVLTALILMRAIKFLLNPLQQIRDKADAVILHDFGEPLPLPSTTELRSVVEAINSMSATLDQQFRAQSDEAQELRAKAYRDQVSQLGNRAYFISRLNAWVEEDGSGGVLLLSVDVLEDIYREEGFAARDDLVRAVAGMLDRFTKPIDYSVMSRISATEFALVLPGYEIGMLTEFGEQLNAKIADLVINPIDNSGFISVVGIAVRQSGETATMLLTKADNALQQARQQRNGAVYIHTLTDAGNLGRLSWKRLVSNAISNRALIFSIQSVQTLSCELLHDELFTAIRYQGQTFSAGQFIPAVEQFQLGGEFDLCVLELLLTKISPDRATPIAVNLSVSALISSVFKPRFLSLLEQNTAYAGTLIFEIPEVAMVKHPQPLVTLLAQINARGFSYGIDQFGRHFQSLNYLQTLRPVYVKIDHGYTQRITDSEIERQFLGAVCRTAHHLSIPTIATRIENSAQQQLLAAIHVDGYQGFIHPPVELD